MNDLIPSLHLVVRQQQRGIRPKDVAMVYLLAREVTPSRFWLSNKDADREIAARKTRIRQLERTGADPAQPEVRRLHAEIVQIDSLRGWLVVAEGERGITVFHRERRPHRQTRRRILQSRRRSQQ